MVATRRFHRRTLSSGALAQDWVVPNVVSVDFAADFRGDEQRHARRLPASTAGKLCNARSSRQVALKRAVV